MACGKPGDFRTFLCFYHGRRFPFASISHTFSIRLLRVSVSFAVSSQSMKFRRSFESSVFHCALARGCAPSALYSGIGTTAKQHGRLFPEASREGILSTRLFRVSACFAESIQRMKSRRASGVREFHRTKESPVSALRKSGGTFASMCLFEENKYLNRAIFVFLRIS